jgi:SAM-dependent methyltransferase
MTSTELPYTGVDNLEVMQEAENYNRFLVSLVTREIRPELRILDFGAGIGTFAREVQAKGFRVCAVEPDIALRQRLSEASIENHGSCAELPAASVDFIYTLNVLEHIEADDAAARELARVLRPGGRLLVYVPAFQILFTSMDRKVGHVRRYRRDGLVRLLKGAGLAIERAGYVDSLGFFATLAYRLVDNGAGSINRAGLRAYDRIAFPVSRVLDRGLSPLFGKNLLAIATKPAA